MIDEAIQSVLIYKKWHSPCKHGMTNIFVFTIDKNFQISFQHIKFL